MESIKIEDEKETKSYFNFSTATTNPIMSVTKSTPTTGISTLSKSVTPRRSKHEVGQALILLLFKYILYSYNVKLVDMNTNLS